MFQEMPIDEEEAIRLYESGLSLKEVGERLGCSYETVRRRLKNRGIVIRNRRARISLSVEREICALYDKGLTNEQIASKFGICPPTVTRIAKRCGCHLHGKGSNSGNGGRAYAAACKARLMERFAQVSDKVEYLSGNADSITVRCKACGRTFWWDNDRMWSMNVPCPRCRGTDNESRHVAKLQREYERKQQLEAAREWRLSVPRVCKECGEPFWSESETAAYCSDGCRKRAKNRKRYERRKRNGRRACSYRHRMRIEKTPETYDPSVTLDALYKRKRGKCAMCGCKTIRTGKYHPHMATLDHIVALGNNGTHTWDNVQLLCNECNSTKRDLGQMRLAI